ncbi:MAG: DUF1501 domain-containing protein [Pirellula sp.]|nr:DUF1501 domain-containing protein [Pirellula sp.]
MGIVESSSFSAGAIMLNGTIPLSDNRYTRRAAMSSLGSIALAAMLHRDGYASDGDINHQSAYSPPSGQPHFPPKAKSVIWLFMNGGVSHVESFDPKPMLTKYAGKTISETPFASTLDPEKLAIERLVVPDANGNQRTELYPLQVGFQKYGDSGLEISDWFPHIGKNADRIAVVRSMWTTDSNHGAQTQFHTGRHRNDGEFPTLGAWVHYGLGSLNEELPQFISLGTREYWNKRDGYYLGPSHDAVPLKIDPANPLDYAKQEVDIMRPGKQRSLELLREYRMQNSIPKVVDFSDETDSTKSLYGIDRPECRDFGMQLLATRRMIERGVRFIQVQHGGGGAGAWDAHGGLKANHTANAAAVDQPIGGLLTDLHQRGLLDETLVVFASEFGRTPGSQGSDGRDHHIFGFSVWMAGGGIKGGIAHGATDEIGFHAVENRHYVTDIHATILKQLGLDSRRLELPGRKRLEIDHGSQLTS